MDLGVAVRILRRRIRSERRSTPIQEKPMKKLSLEIEALAVDTFTTGDAGAGRGTVRGHDTRYTEFCNTRSCGAYTYCCLAADEPKPAEPQEPLE
jgi:hypothetical protein